MANYMVPKSVLGTRIMDFRKSNALTQADLADRYEISGPAVFKFEKGFVTPSLKLWNKMSADMDIPTKEAVLIWVKEKLPERMHKYIQQTPALDVGDLQARLEEVAGDEDAHAKMADIVLGHPDIAPSIKEFVGKKDIWNILKPSVEEVLFMLEIEDCLSRLSVEQFRDLMVVARAIRLPDAD